MGSWTNSDAESVKNIQSIIDEHTLFKKCQSFNYTTAVKDEFDTLTGLARTVEQETVLADSMQIAADVAAVAAIWSFGFGMAAFAALEVDETIARAVASKHSKELNKKLKTADDDISKNISTDVASYVTLYKANNTIIANNASKGMDQRECRSVLFQFMAEIERRGDEITVATFQKDANSASVLYNSTELDQVYAALDGLNLSEKKSDADIKKFMDTLKGVTIANKSALSTIRNLSYGIMFYKLNLATTKIKTLAEEAELPVEEVDANAFEVMDATGKFVAGIAIVMSVWDIVNSILDIVDVVAQSNKMCTALEGTIQKSYLDYFKGIQDSSNAYNAAIAKAAIAKK